MRLAYFRGLNGLKKVWFGTKELRTLSQQPIDGCCDKKKPNRLKGQRQTKQQFEVMEWYKVRYGTTEDNQQYNVQARSEAEALEKFKQTDYWKWGNPKPRIFSVSKL